MEFLVKLIDVLRYYLLSDVKSVNVTSGASTPDIVTSEVISYLKQFEYNKKETWDHVSNLTFNDILKI